MNTCKRCRKRTREQTHCLECQRTLEMQEIARSYRKEDFYVDEEAEGLAQDARDEARNRSGEDGT